MPIPIILGAIALAAGVGGVCVGVKGAIDLSNANDTLNKAKKRDEENLRRHKIISEKACNSMDDLGRLEMKILSSFKTFADIVEKIKNRPSFEEIKIGDVVIPKFDPKELEQASIGAGILMGGLGGAAFGTAGGFAASGATTAAVMAFGTASTGTAISALNGVAATNATLAALGGGSLAAGGGGMALGSAILGGASLGIGLLVGGIIFKLVGSNISDKADEAYNQMLENEKVINRICSYLESLDDAAREYFTYLEKAYAIYDEQLKIMRFIVDANKRSDGMVDWMQLRPHEKTIVNNAVMLVGLLYQMCKVKIVKKTVGEDQINVVNSEDINDAQTRCIATLKAIGSN